MKLRQGKRKYQKLRQEGKTVIYFRKIKVCEGMKRFGNYAVLGLLICVLFTFMLSACTGSHIEEGEAEAVLEKGQEMFEGWLAENMPEAKIKHIDAYLDYPPGGQPYLTDYIYGALEMDGEEQFFAMNTLSGQVYLDRDKELESSVRAYLLEILGLEEETAFYSFHVASMIPAVPEGSERHTFRDSFNLGIPAEVEDVDAYVRDAANRDPFELMVEMQVPEEYDLSEWSLERFNQMKAENGLTFQYIHLSNDTQRADLSWNREMSYSEYGWGDLEGFKLWYGKEYRKEELDEKTGEISVTVQQMVPEEEIHFSETEDGIRIECPDLVEAMPFEILVPAGSELLEHEYYVKSDDGLSDAEVIWEEAEIPDSEAGWYRLVYADGIRFRVYGSCTLTVREER